MNKFVKYILILLVLAAVSGAGAWYYVFNKPHKNMLNETPDFVLTATDLFAEFETDEDVANAKYLGKTLEISGEIVEVNQTENRYEILFEDSMQGVTCLIDSTFSANNEALLKQLTEGKQVTVRGKCNGMLMDVKMNMCVLVE